MQDNLFSFPLLAHSDCEALLKFERRNRFWFESNINGRSEDFYCLKGVSSHIRDCLHQYHELTMLPTLIKNSKGDILGRANLHSIDLSRGEAWVGYRVAEQCAGQGLASKATEQLIRYASSFSGLKYLKAYASTQNIASQRVLLRNNFKMVGNVNDFGEVNGAMIDCYEYQLELQTPFSQWC